MTLPKLFKWLARQKMDCSWIKSSSSLKRGIDIINQLEDTKFEQFLRRIVVKLKLQDSEIFSEDEKKKLEKIFNINDEQLVFAIKTIIYIFKRILKFIFMPANLTNDLQNLGLIKEKTAYFVKVWSTETSLTLNDLASTQDKCEENPDFHWKLNTELSSGYQRKCKIPKAYVKFLGRNNDVELELTHQELHSIFLQVESIQNELDNLM